MEVESVLVTGANRGIGLEFVKQLVKLPNPPRFVFATYRDESTIQALAEIKDTSKDTQVVLVRMDITQQKDIERARQIIEGEVGDKGLNLLINNAAVLKVQGFQEITAETMMLHFSTNTVGPVMVVKEMLPLLQKAAALQSAGMNISRAAVLNISAGGGSITELTEAHPRRFLAIMGYRTSKAAVNMAMRVISLTIKDQGILVVSMCPGWVNTDMGANRDLLADTAVEALLTVEQSVSDMLKTLPLLNDAHHGSFINRNGETIRY